jgi:hypothetical protein
MVVGGGSGSGSIFKTAFPCESVMTRTALLPSGRVTASPGWKVVEGDPSKGVNWSTFAPLSFWVTPNAPGPGFGST